MHERLSIIVVEADQERALRIVDGLREAGDHDILVISESTSLDRRIADRKPDIVLIDAGNPSRDMLEELARRCARSAAAPCVSACRFRFRPTRN